LASSLPRRPDARGQPRAFGRARNRARPPPDHVTRRPNPPVPNRCLETSRQSSRFRLDTDSLMDVPLSRGCGASLLPST
jgi:hypothetical protein